MPRRWWLACFLLLPLAAGCLRLERDYPEKNFFGLEARRPAMESAAPLFGTLRLEKFRVASPFQGRPFLYRADNLRYEEDFYNRFLASPAELLTAESARWLRASALFAQVDAGPAANVPEYVLDGHVSALYGDFRQRPAQAVLEIDFTLLREEGARPQTVLRREYRREIPLEQRTPAALAAGWSEALAQILAELERDLRGAER